MMERLRNKTTSRSLVKRVKWAKSHLLRVKGLLGKKSYREQALIIHPCQQVHTWFMAFPIDILFLDKDYKVIAIERGLKPWAISQKQVDAAMVIEAEAGVFSEDRVTVGDELTIEKVDWE